LNIEASISRRKKYITYNPKFMNWVTNVTNDKWAAIALFAHEIGHHINKHTSRLGGSKPKLELEADEFAGYVLRKMGATLEESQLVMKYIATTATSKTHPCRSDRMVAIQKGWNKAAEITTSLTRR
jgi:ribosomal protein L19